MAIYKVSLASLREQLGIFINSGEAYDVRQVTVHTDSHNVYENFLFQRCGNKVARVVSFSDMSFFMADYLKKRTTVFSCLNCVLSLVDGKIVSVLPRGNSAVSDVFPIENTYRLKLGEDITHKTDERIVEGNMYVENDPKDFGYNFNLVKHGGKDFISGTDKIKYENLEKHIKEFFGGSEGYEIRQVELEKHGLLQMLFLKNEDNPHRVYTVPMCELITYMHFMRNDLWRDNDENIIGYFKTSSGLIILVCDKEGHNITDIYTQDEDELDCGFLNFCHLDMGVVCASFKVLDNVVLQADKPATYDGKRWSYRDWDVTYKSSIYIEEVKKRVSTSQEAVMPIECVAKESESDILKVVLSPFERAVIERLDRIIELLEESYEEECE